MTLCPCSSGKPYPECCQPLHRGEREAATAGELMRSRYSGFALKEVPYLWRTLHPEHPDRKQEQSEGLRSLRAVVQMTKYPGLHVLEERAPDETGTARVLFLAKVFSLGKNHSFVELSDFQHDGTGWRYLRGAQRILTALKGDPLALTIDAFRAVLAGR